jgi:hypothetical protein
MTTPFGADECREEGLLRLPLSSTSMTMRFLPARLSATRRLYRREEIKTMSTDFLPRRLITAADLFGGRLEKHGVRERIVKPKDVHEWAAEMGVELAPGASGKLPGTTEHSRCLSDGTNYVWVQISKRGFVALITRYGLNDAQTILDAIAQEFETDIISEHDAEFWENYEGAVVAIDMSDSEVIKGGSRMS